MDLTSVVYRLSDAEVFHFTFLTESAASTKHAGVIKTLAESFRRLDDETKAKVKPQRIRVVAVQPGDTIDGLASRMAVPDFHRERFQMLNAIETDEQLRAAKHAKLIVTE